MSFGFQPDPDQIRRQEEAGVLLLRVGLAMIDDARRGDGFETDEAKLTARVDEVLSSLGAKSPRQGEAAVRATPEDRDRVLLSAPTGEGTETSSLLRADGVLLEGYSSISISAEEVDMAELSAEQEEELRRAQEAYEEQMRHRFQGNRFLRALAVAPQPGSQVQILAAELFDDGLVVHFTHNQDSESGEPEPDLLRAFEPSANIRVEDDLGTEYRHHGDGGGGVKVVHSTFSFSPAVPDAASTLRITSRSGTVELPL